MLHMLRIFGMFVILILTYASMATLGYKPTLAAQRLTALRYATLATGTFENNVYYPTYATHGCYAT